MTETKEMTKKYLGKISSVTFGKGGYQDAQFGLSLTFEGSGWGTSWFKGDWDIERSKHAKWTEEERTNRFGDLIHFMRDLFKKSKISELNQLKGIPVEATFINNTLSEWRILEEVL